MADRSLSFFASLYPGGNSKDPNTGMDLKNESVEFNINKYDPNDPLTRQSSENKTANYSVVQSTLNDDQYINYMGNSTTNDYRPYNPGADVQNDASLSSIITWTQQSHKSLKLSYGHFAFLKDFGVYPTNHLMILRRFNGAVNHNLFNTTATPAYTLATYYSFDEDFLNISFKEGWETFNDSIMKVLSDVIGVDLGTIPGVGKLVNSETLGSALVQDIMKAVAQSLGFVTPDTSIYGDPNVIYAAAIRKIGDSDDEFGGSLQADIQIKFKVHYTLKEINGIDAKAAMMDVIANAIHMGTSNGKFLLTGQATDSLNDFIRKFEAGKVEEMIDSVLAGLKGILDKVKDGIVNSKAAQEAKSGNVGGAIEESLKALEQFGSDLLKQRFLRYKWKIRGAVGALSGMHTAPWHISIGNPKNPWFSCGNLVVENCTIKNGEGAELSYNDFPTEWVFEYTLKNGRPMGANELSSLFNGGRGRVYDTPDKLQNVNISSNSSYKLPGQQSSDNGVKPENKNTGSTQQHNTSQVDTDQKNDLKKSGVSTTPFALNNEDIDPNIPRTNN